MTLSADKIAADRSGTGTGPEGKCGAKAPPESVRAISRARLKASPPVHLRPINVIVSDGPPMKSILAEGFALRCVQRLSKYRRGYPAVRLAAQPADRRSARHGPLVLVPGPRKFQTPAIDRDRTVSRRSEPSSRATLMGEQPNPWDLLSLLSPEYLLSFERRPVRKEPPDHYALVSHLLGVSASQSSALMPLHCKGRLPIGLRAPLEASVTLLEATTPVKLPAMRSPPIKRGLAPGHQEGRISTAAPPALACGFLCLRPILHTG